MRLTHTFNDGPSNSVKSNSRLSVRPRTEADRRFCPNHGELGSDSEMPGKHALPDNCFWLRILVSSVRDYDLGRVRNSQVHTMMTADAATINSAQMKVT
jgi:hypothetical protein